MKLHQGNKLPIRLLMRLISLFAVLLLGLMTSQVAIAANSEHLTQLISTKSCENCDLTDLELTYIDLEAADLANSDLTNSRLPGQSLKSATLTSANLQNTNLSSADLSYANLANANLVQADLSGAILSSADLTRADLTGANLENARLLGFAGRANFTAANLSQANLKGTRLNDLSFAGANLSHADLSGGVYLAGADFSDAILDGANFSGANFSGANLQNTSWQNADLTGTNLRRADLTGANLTGANLAAINLDDAILYKTVGLDPYAEELIQTAEFVAKSEDYPGAISYLEKIPFQTESHVKAQNLIAEYTEKQQIKDQESLDADVQEKLAIAAEAANSNNYRRAIRILQNISDETSLYNKVQNNIALYTEKQELKEKAEREDRERRIAQAQAEAASLQREIPTIKNALKPYNPSVVEIWGKTLRVVLPQAKITNQMYGGVMQNGVCAQYQIGRIKMLGVKSIVILDQDGKQGFVFEGGADDCNDLSDQKLSSMTHRY